MALGVVLVSVLYRSRTNRTDVWMDGWINRYYKKRFFTRIGSYSYEG